MQFKQIAIGAIKGALTDYHSKPENPLGALVVWYDSNHYENHAVYALNGTGAALVLGQHCCLDLSTTPDGTDLYTAIKPAAAALERFLGAAMSAIPNAQHGWFKRKGPDSNALVEGSTANVAAKDPLGLVAGQWYLNKAQEGCHTMHLLSVDAADIADGDLVTTVAMPFAGRILKVYCVVEKAITTTGKSTDINLEIGTTNLTGGVVDLNSASGRALGYYVAGTAITAANSFKNGDTISVEAANTTSFIEGRVGIYCVVQDESIVKPIAYAAEAQTGTSAAKDVVYLG